jgi:hypothetical protein
MEARGYDGTYRVQAFGRLTATDGAVLAGVIVYVLALRLLPLWKG